MSRSFSGPGHVLKVGIGAIPATGAFSMAVVTKFEAPGAGRNLMERHALNGDAEQFWITDTNKLSLGADSPSAVVEDVWSIFGVSKAAGLTVPRFHYYRFDTRVWVHENAPSAVADSTTTAWDGVWWGSFLDDFYGFHAAGGWWSSVLSDANFEVLPPGLYNWVPLSPVAFWDFNDNPVVDLSGGGANQVDDTSLGVVLTEYPPGFSFELVAPQAVAPVATVAADSWTAVGAPTVWEAVDETVASDAEYAESPDATATGHEMKLRFSSVSDPASGEGHILSWRYSKSALGGNVVKLIATLYRADGTTVVKTMTIENIEASVYGSFTLSVAEADSIPTGDYATGLVVGFKEVVV